MSSSQDQRDYSAWIAILGSAFLMAHHNAGKVARDSLFLLNYPSEYLPRMDLASAGISLLLVLVWSRNMAARSPSRLVPLALLGSAIAEITLWFSYKSNPGVSAVLFYIFMIGPNAILLSSFWALLNERFDPRKAKRLFARIAAGGTVGIVISSGVAERVSGRWGPSSQFLLLALIYLLGFFAIRALAAGVPPRQARPGSPAADLTAAFRTLRSNRYLRTLATLFFLVAVSAKIMDLVFKRNVADALSGEALVSFFAIYYGLAGLGTFLVQSFVAPSFFQRFGLTQSLLSLPIAYGMGVLAKVAIPGSAGLGIMRGLEQVARQSIFRSGYEVCYTPVTNQEKRAAKTLIDVGADRSGDMAGSLVVQGVISSGSAMVTLPLLSFGCFVSGVAGVFIYRLGRMYVQTLESSLITRAREIEEEADELPDFTADRIVVGSLSSIDLSGLRRTPPRVNEATPTAPTEELAPPPKGQQHTPTVTPESEFQNQPILRRIAQLNSGDYAQVRTALLNRAELEPGLVPFLIRLLAWDEVSDLVIRLLRRSKLFIDGQLADVLLNPNEDFAIRRRVPRILSVRATQLSAEALIQGLRDQRFEVRFRCSHALAAITLVDAGLFIDRDRILRAVEREFYVSKTVWNSYRLLERVEDSEEDAYFDEVLKDRTSKGLEHVFTLLSLVLPREPLQIAFKGLHTSDPHLRGTALEYLESVLPPSIRERLWPFLEDSAASAGEAHGTRRSRDEILADLRRSNQSIIVNLESLRGKGGHSPSEGHSNGLKE